MDRLEEQLLKMAYAKGISSQGKWLVASHLIQSSKKILTFEEIIKIGRITTHRELFRQSWTEIEENWASLKKERRFITCFDPRYPQQLLHLAYPPIILFYKGDLTLLNSKMLSVVGGRRSSILARKTVYRLLGPVIEAGYVIVSGCAKGIDTFSHHAAIHCGGKTIGVIGTGIDQAYPPESRDLQEKIGKEHLLLSEYPPQAGPKKHRFPMRNRIIAALSQGTCVIEAKKKSGSLITAQQALDLGRTVFSVPGNILTEHSTGCHHLIQDGAVCAVSGQDILAEFK
ncbi:MULTISPECIES: DNA-processing protein DprA [unclassified Enterococcus]|uniref:DNA-processing protein DprA n=1 Tax=unclassified Enterococcus TaxID=2608891 RepID=UPI0013EB1BF7|nr:MULTISPECIES: DNA-processing protein DprA [unclassified Enterococcus]